MKEKIYTIPVNEAYDTDCECPLCELEKKLERETIEYTLGAAMMEPDFRSESNEKGFCRRHFGMLFEMPKKLPMALVLDTHLEETRKKLDELSKQAAALGKQKGGLFKKTDASGFAAALSETLGKTGSSCIICDRINHTMERYADVLLYMWANDEQFKEKFDRSKGLCLKHTRLLCDAAPKSLKDSQAAQFMSEMFAKQSSELSRLQEEIHRFTLKFDYRNRDMDWNGAQDAPLRVIEKLTGYIKTEDAE